MLYYRTSNHTCSYTHLKGRVNKIPPSLSTAFWTLNHFSKDEIYVHMKCTQLQKFCMKSFLYYSKLNHLNMWIINNFFTCSSFLMSTAYRSISISYNFENFEKHNILSTMSISIAPRKGRCQCQNWFVRSKINFTFVCYYSYLCVFCSLLESSLKPFICFYLLYTFIC